MWPRPCGAGSTSAAAARCAPVPEVIGASAGPLHGRGGVRAGRAGSIRAGPCRRSGPTRASPCAIGRHAALVHNAETLAHVAMIARTGAGGVRARGAPEDPGTSLVTVTGGGASSPAWWRSSGRTPLIDIARPGCCRRGEPQALLVGGYGGAWVAPPALRHAVRLAARCARIGATAGVGIVVVLGPTACGLMESARIVTVSGRPERGPVRTVRLRAAGHRRRPDPAGAWGEADA